MKELKIPVEKVTINRTGADLIKRVVGIQSDKALTWVQVRLSDEESVVERKGSNFVVTSAGYSICLDRRSFKVTNVSKL